MTRFARDKFGPQRPELGHGYRPVPGGRPVWGTLRQAAAVKGIHEPTEVHFLLTSGS